MFKQHVNFMIWTWVLLFEHGFWSIQVSLQTAMFIGSYARTSNHLWFNVLTLRQRWIDVVSTLCACWDTYCQDTGLTTFSSLQSYQDFHNPLTETLDKRVAMDNKKTLIWLCRYVWRSESARVGHAPIHLFGWSGYNIMMVTGSPQAKKTSSTSSSSNWVVVVIVVEVVVSFSS